MRAALQAAGVAVDIRETALSRTAAEAADALGCAVDQIAKSILLKGEDSGMALLFITAGAQQVDLKRATMLAGEPLTKADAALIRAQTGFAIGGVSPVGHLTPIRAWFDPKLMEFATIWAAAGTPHHVFRLPPSEILKLSCAEISAFTTG